MLQAGYDIAGIGVADLGVSFADLDFARRSIPCISSAGTRYNRSIPVGMPKIERRLLDTVVYLYADRASAEAGKNFGGTGFMAFLPGEMFPESTAYFYAITNWHVAVRDGFSTIRINTTDGIDVFEFEPHEWHFMPQYDIAVIPMPFNAQRHKAAMIKSDFFVKRELFSEQVLGVGSDVFMLGRFIDHDGGQTNMPAARFGHISVLPAPIMQPNHAMADSFCIDMHSRTGFSGSPVFAYKIPSSEFAESAGDDPYFGLLGIQWGQFPEQMAITEEEKSEATKSHLGGAIRERHEWHELCPSGLDNLGGSDDAKTQETQERA